MVLLAIVLYAEKYQRSRVEARLSICAYLRLSYGYAY